MAAGLVATDGVGVMAAVVDDAGELTGDADVEAVLVFVLVAVAVTVWVEVTVGVATAELVGSLVVGSPLVGSPLGVRLTSAVAEPLAVG